MSRTRLSPIDILGITLGAITILIVAGSVVTIARGRMFDARSFLGAGGPWNARNFSFGPGVTEEKDEQVPAGATEIELRNVAGSIDIRGNTAMAVHSVRTAPFEAALENLRVDIRMEGNRLIVTEKHDPGFMSRAGKVSFRVTVPRGVKLIAAHSISGGITVRGIESGVDQVLSTISGGITTERAMDLDASSTSGSIRFTSSGSSLNVRSISGSITGVIESLGTGGLARMSTVSGSVSLNAWPGLDAAVSLHSLSGRVSCDFPVTTTEQKNNRLSGTIGTGAAALDVGTVSGSISISKM
jgi:Putative adhesin